ncbi:MAG: hypothetical protein Q8M20_07475 [Rhodocyclaceae bacterium]|nr:hypothetical protein [Rhodocyclaceae bacterium]MDZ4214256.1 hypothetical protein [Rhodocyclaceae bacterium]
MKYLSVLLTSCLLMVDAQAAQDFACMQDCFRQGYDRSYCVPMCNTSGGGMLDQPGLPKNPAFDQVQPNTPKQRLPAVADHKCMKDCQRRGYNYMLCQKQCSYSFNDH